MPRKIKCKNGRTFTYLSPKEKRDKYEMELELNFKITGDYDVKVSAGYNLQNLTFGQRKYREDYISLYDMINQKSNSKGLLDFVRDYENYMKYTSQNRSKNKKIK